MKNYFTLLLLLMCSNFVLQAQVSGTVYRDYNGNSIQGLTAPNFEPGVPGVVVNAYNSIDELIATQTTNSTGGYSFPASGANSIANGTAVRLEFVLPNGCSANAAFDFSTFGGVSNATSVRFVTGGSGATNINYGINNPSDYNTGGANSWLFTTTLFGGTTSGGASSTQTGLVGWPYTNTGTSPAPSRSITALNLGSTWGLAYSKQAQKLFVGAFVKRHMGLKGSSGQIFLVSNLTSGTMTAIDFFDLDRGINNVSGGGDDIPTRFAGASPVYGSGSSYSVTVAGPNQTLSYLGSVDPLSGMPVGAGIVGTNAIRGLNDDNTIGSVDAAAYGQVGKVGLGDIDISDDGRYLFVTNLYDRKIYRLTLNSATNPTAVTAVTSITIPNPPLRSTRGTIGAANFANTYTGANNGTNFYDGTRGFQRPFAVKVHRGKVYFGTVTTGEFGGLTTIDNNTGDPEYTDLWTYVWEYDIAAGTFTSAPLVQEPLNFNRGTDGDGVDESWTVWNNVFNTSNTFRNATSGHFASLSDIEFDESGAMILGFRDNQGDMGGGQNQSLVSGANFYTIAFGDILRAGFNSTNCIYGFERNASDGTVTTNGAGSLYYQNQGPSNYNGDNGEFYWRDNIWDGNTNTCAGSYCGGGTPELTNHTNTPLGGLAQLKGSRNTMSTNMDPLDLWSGGVSAYNSVDGGNPADYQIYDGFPGIGSDPGKANGLGDLELITATPPIEIGNRIWNDANGDGIQNPGEAPISNVSLELFLDANSDGVPDGAAIGSVTTDANGNYTFSSATGTDATGVDFGVNIIANQNYLIRPASSDWNSTTGVGVGDLSGFQLTRTDKLGNGQVDLSDNDAALTSGAVVVPQISVLVGAAGQNNHNLDFGFKTLASIGDRVWLDNGVGAGTANNGIQDGTEPGVAGVTVTLYRNGADGLPGTADDVVVGTTVTDAFGNYLFDNLIPSTSAATSYNVGFTLPANHQFTTQTNTQVTGSSDVTNTTTVSGGSTAANGSDANTTTGRTGSFWLAPGEAERGADAGLIFTPQPSANTIGDRVWFDSDGNGLQNGTEPGVAGVTVSLYRDLNNDGDLDDAGENVPFGSTVTDANGNYQFFGIPDGSYKVGFTLPSGFTFTSKDASGSGAPGSVTDGTTDSDVNTSGINFGKTDVISVDPTSATAVPVVITNVDAGLIQQPTNTASLGDKVWNDLNNNGTQDAGEPGIPNVVVNLYQDANNDGVLTGGELTPFATTMTDAFGNYMFNSLPVTGSNRWQVEFVQPAGFSNTAVPNNNSGNDATDSDIINDGTDRTGFINLRQGERNLSVDAGFVQTTPAGSLRLGDKVWRDDDADGQQDAGEAGVAGVSVLLFQNGPDGLPGTADDVLVSSTVTDVNGNYLFTNLAASTNAATGYNVFFASAPQGFVFTTPDQGADATDSDANGIGRTASINLTADNLTVDAGLVQGVPAGLGALGDKVWYDLDNDGIQDAGELGVAGVTATLQRDNNGDGDFTDLGETVGTTTTNALGEYSFTNLALGSYRVIFSNMPNGFIISPSNAGGNDAADSDGDNGGTTITSGVTSTTGVYVVGPGQENLTVDLGISPAANTNSLSGTAWFDTDNDGLQGVTPPNVQGVTVTLYTNGLDGLPGTADDVVVGTTTTDENGNYQFAGLPDGNYNVGFTNFPAGFDVATRELTNTNAGGSDADRTSGRTGSVTLGVANRNDVSLDLGLVSTRASLGNRVWDDLDGDGIQDAGEPGVAGVQVILYAADGITVLSSTITDANGNYLFTNLPAGNYIVGVNPATLPAGMQFTTQNNTSGPDGDGANTWTGGGDSDVTNAGFTSVITLGAGQSNLTVDAGVRRVPVATIGNRVWDDANSNGTQDAGEPGVGGVVVTLFNSANQPIGTTVTDGNGNWLITNVPVGSGYYVIFSNTPTINGTPTTFTTQDVGGVGTGGGTDVDTDSDVNPSGQSGTFNVTPSTTNLIIDAGIRLSVALSVNYTNFTAVAQSNTTQLSFSVGVPAVGTVFTIERSLNGTNFTSIGNVSGSNATSYNYTDNLPVLNAKNYYRIKAVDARGSVNYSVVRVVRFGGDKNVEVFPVPAVSVLNVSLSGNAVGKQLSFIMYSADGKEVMRKQVSSASSTEQLDVSQLTSGIYQLRVLNGNEILSTTKVSVQ
jgi:hypothetical protein